MKTYSSAVLMFICLTLGVDAQSQAPTGINFQAVLRNDAGNALVNQQVTINVKLKNSAESNAIYQEAHTVSTNNFGQVNIIIGKGTNIVGDFANIPWSQGTVFMDAQATFTDGKVLQLGIQQLNAVPFAFHANTAQQLTGPHDPNSQNELIESLTLNNSTLSIIEGGQQHSIDLLGIIDNDSDPANEIQQLQLQNMMLSLSNSDVAVDLSSLKDDDDADPANEIQGLTLTGPILNITGNDTPVNLGPYLGANTDEQTLDFSGTTLSITGGNSVDLESLANDADADPTNEIQELNIDGTTLSITGANSPINIGELGIGNQNLTLDGTTLSISSGNSVDLSPLANDADANPTNEIQNLTVTGTTLNLTGVSSPINLAALNIEDQNLNFVGTTLSISEGNSVNLESLKDDADANPSNELQSLTISGSTLNITGANSPINLSALNIDDQQLSLSGTMLSISDGNSVDLASLEDDADASATNEIQGLTLTGSTLNITGNNTPIDLAPFLGTNTDAQTLNYTAGSLSISGGNSVDLSALEDDADASPTNEIQGLTLTGSTLNITGNNTPINLAPFLGVNTDAQTLNFSGNTLSIAGGNAIDLSSLEDDADASPTNEIQGLTVSGSILNITGANTPVNLSSFSVDDQTLQFQGTVLSISEGNAVDLASLGNDADADPTNEIQGLTFSNNILNITGNTTPIDLTPLQGATNLQQAYQGGASIQLNALADLRVNTDAGAPLLSLNNANARVGIGTITPTTSLDVVSPTPSASPNLRVANSDGTHAMTLFGGRTGDPNPFVSVHPSDPLRLGHFDGTTFTERARITPSGNMGLGTNGPSHKLHIVTPTSAATAEFVGYEAGVLIDATEANTSALNNIGLASVVRAANQASYSIMGAASTPSQLNRGVFGYAAGGTVDNIGVYGWATSAAGENMGVRGLAGGALTNYGVLGRSVSSGTNNYGGYFQGQLGTAANYGIRALATGTGTTNYGIYASATGGTSNYAGYFLGNVLVSSGTLTLQSGGLTMQNGNLTLQSGHLINQTGNINIVSGMLQKNATQLIDQRHNGIYVGGGAGTANAGVAFRTIAIGGNALTAHTSGPDNVAIGWHSMQSSVDVTRNTALGSYSMSAATGELQGNTAIGAESLQTLNGGRYNTAVGLFSMRTYAAGENNVALGFNTMSGTGGGSSNVAVGANALTGLSGGAQNVVVGANAGGSITTNSNNIIIGPSADVAPGVNNSVAIGANAIASQSSTIVLGDAADANIRVGIGTSSPAEKLHVIGNVFVSGDVTGTTLTQSDRRLKTQVENLISPLETIEKIQGVSYYWLDKRDESKQYGVIAQEIEKLLPDIVKTNDAGIKAVNYTALIPFLVEAIKSQQKQIEKLEAENDALATLLKIEISKLSERLDAAQAVSPLTNIATDKE